MGDELGEVGAGQPPVPVENGEMDAKMLRARDLLERVAQNKTTPLRAVEEEVDESGNLDGVIDATWLTWTKLKSLDRASGATSPAPSAANTASNPAEPAAGDALAASSTTSAKSTAQQNVEVFVKLLYHTKLKKAAAKEAVLERLDLDLLEAAGLCEAKRSRERAVRFNTNLKFRQVKFNLEREESEGFAKLVSELHLATLTDGADKVAESNIRACVGAFRLDPNRTLDVCLEWLGTVAVSPAARRTRPGMDLPAQRILGLIDQLFPQCGDRFASLMGFKYSSKQLKASELEALNRVCAMLIATPGPTPESRFTVLDILPHLSPSIDEYRRKLAAQETLLTEAKSKVSSFAEPTQASSSPSDAAETRLDSDQVTGLLAALIESEGGFGHAETLMDLVLADSELSPNALARIPSVSQPLRNMLRVQLDKVWSSVPGLSRAAIFSPASKPSTPATTAAAALEFIAPYLLRAGNSLKEDVELLHRLVRLSCCAFAEFEASRSKDAAQTKEVETLVLPIVANVLLPNISCLSSPVPAIVEELWDGILTHLGHASRFAMYDRVRATGLNDPERILRSAHVTFNASGVLKRMAKDPEVIRFSSRRFAKETTNDPLNSMLVLVRNIQVYDNLIPAVVESLNIVPSLGFDVLVYCVNDMLSNPSRDRLKEDGENIALWLSSTCKLVGLIMSKYHDRVDIEPLLHLVYARLTSSNRALMFDVLLLRSIVAETTGIDASEADEGLEAVRISSCGARLRKLVKIGESMKVGSKPSFARIYSELLTKSTIKLVRGLDERMLVKPLLLGLGYSCARLLYEDETKLRTKRHSRHSRPLQTSKMLYDSLTAILHQFVDFCGAASSSTNTALTEGLLKSEDMLELASTCGTNFVFLLLRAMKRTSPLEASMTSEPLLTSLRPASTTGSLTLAAFEEFWMSELPDVSSLDATYKAEIEKRALAVSAAQAEAAKSNHTDKMALKNLNFQRDSHGALVREAASYDTRYETGRARLRLKGADMFPTLGSVSVDQAFADEFVQLCVLPRASASHLDALYTATAIERLHSVNHHQKGATIGFPTIAVLDAVFQRVVPAAVYASTEREVGCLAILLTHLATLAEKWRDPKAFEQECSGTPGFARALDAESSSAVDHGKYLALLGEWHDITIRTLIDALGNAAHPDVMGVFQAFAVLGGLIEVWPRTIQATRVLSSKLEVFNQHEKEDDAFGESSKTKANRLVALLKKKTQQEGKLYDAVTGAPFKPAPPSKKRTAPFAMSAAATVGATNDADVNVKRARLEAPQSKTPTRSVNDTASSNRPGSAQEQNPGSKVPIPQSQQKKSPSPPLQPSGGSRSANSQTSAAASGSKPPLAGVATRDDSAPNTRAQQPAASGRASSASATNAPAVAPRTTAVEKPQQPVRGAAAPRAPANPRAAARGAQSSVPVPSRGSSESAPQAGPSTNPSRAPHAPHAAPAAHSRPNTSSNPSAGQGSSSHFDSRRSTSRNDSGADYRGGSVRGNHHSNHSAPYDYNGRHSQPSQQGRKRSRDSRPSAPPSSNGSRSQSDGGRRGNDRR